MRKADAFGAPCIAGAPRCTARRRSWRAGSGGCGACPRRSSCRAEPARSEDCLYSQRLDQRQERRRSPSGDGLDLRRRLHRRLRRHGLVRRREPGVQGSGHRDVQLSPRLARFLRASGAGEGIRPECLRQLRHDGRHRRAAVGEAEHRRVRRRSEQRHRRRRIGRRDHGRRACRFAAGEGSVQPRDRGERRLDGPDDAADDPLPLRRRRTAPRRWTRSASRRSPSCAPSRSRS